MKTEKVCLFTIIAYVAIWHSTVQGFVLRRNGPNECVDQHKQNNNAYTHRCHGKPNQNLYWKNGTIRTRHNNYCLDLNKRNGQVIFYPCHGGNNQKWFWSGKSLKNQHNKRCLTVNRSTRDLIAYDCKDWRTQKWDALVGRVKTSITCNIKDRSDSWKVNSVVKMEGHDFGSNGYWCNKNNFGETKGVFTKFTNGKPGSREWVYVYSQARTNGYRSKNTKKWIRIGRSTEFCFGDSFDGRIPDIGRGPVSFHDCNQSSRQTENALKYRIEYNRL